MVTESTLFRSKMASEVAQHGHRHPKRRPKRRRSPLTIEQILAWADAHYERTSKWPNLESGRISGAPLSETWWAVDKALRTGKRGLSVV